MALRLLLPLALAALALGAPVALLGARFRSSIRAFNRRAVALPGVVVGHRAFTLGQSSSRRHLTEALVRCTTPDGRVVEAKGLVRPSAEPAQPLTGTTVEVLFDPVSGETSLDGPRGKAGVADALFRVGVACCALGGAALVASVLSR